MTINYWNKREELRKKAIKHTSDMAKFEKETIESVM